MAKNGFNIDAVPEPEETPAEEPLHTLEEGGGGNGIPAPASAEEEASRKKYLRTQGRTGCKSPRLNMVFTPDNYDYLKTMSAMYGESIALFCNDIITEYRTENQRVYEMAKTVREAAKRLKDGEENDV